MTTYYIDPAGNDSTGDGSSGSPWFEVEYAATQLSAGDVLKCKTGTYNYGTDDQTISSTGSAGSLITIEEDTGATPIFQFTGSGGLIFSGAEYLTFDGITVDGNDDDSGDLVRLRDGCDNITIQNCTIRDTLGFGIRMLNGNQTNIVVDNCTITLGNNDEPNYSADGILIYGSGTNNITISNNTISEVSHVAIQAVYADNIDIYGNTCTKCGSHGIEIQESSDTVAIYDNVVYGGVAWSSSEGLCNGIFIHEDAGTGPSNVEIYRNEIYKAGHSGIYFRDYVPGPITVYNNVFYECNQETAYTDRGVIRFYQCAGTPDPDITIKNNIIYQDGSERLLHHGSDSDTGSMDFDYNCWYVTGTWEIRYNGTDYSSLANYVAGTVHGDNSIDSDPQFTDAANADFTLTCATSPCKDDGTDVGLPYQGVAPDMGANECSTTGPVTVVVQTLAITSSLEDISISTGTAFDLKLEDRPGSHTAIGSAGDILRARAFNGSTIVDNYLEVQSVTDPGSDYFTYSVIRRSGSSGILPKGVAVINMGATGAVLFEGDVTDNPFIRVVTHNEPWNSMTNHVLIGKLDSGTGAASEWGLAAGRDLSDVANITISNNTFQINCDGVDNAITLDSDGNTTISATSNDRIDFKTAGTLAYSILSDEFQFLDPSGDPTVLIRRSGDLTTEADLWFDGNGGIAAENSIHMLIDSNNTSSTAIFEIAKDADSREESVSGTSLWYVNENNMQVMRLGSVLHGATDIVEQTDAWFQLEPFSTDYGGATIKAMKEDSTAAENYGCFVVQVGLDEDAEDTRSRAGRGLFEIWGGKISGTDWADMNANGNILVVRSRRGGAWEACFIVNEDGDVDYDGALTNYDDEDDVLALESLRVGLSKGWNDALAYNFDRLAAMGVVSGTQQKPMISTKRSKALEWGAIGQNAKRTNENTASIAVLKKRIEELETKYVR